MWANNGSVADPIVIVPPPSDPSPADIDRYGDLHLKVELFAPTLEEHELLRKKIESQCERKAADRPAVIEGLRYQIQLTARRNERTITNKRRVFALLKKTLGLDGVLALITIPLAEGVDKNIPKSLHSTILVQEQSGSRTMKVIPRYPPKVA